MPKDLTKLSLKGFEALSNGEFDRRMNWSHGTLELTVSQVTTSPIQYNEYDDEE